MNLQLIDLGAQPNDRTGDTIRAGGTKINANFQEVYLVGATRHRQCAIVYKTANGAPDFLSTSGLNVTIAGPFVASIAALNDERGERNLAAYVGTTVTNAWTVPNNSTAWLYVASTIGTGVVSFGYSTLEPVESETAPSISTGQYWYDRLAGSVKVWNGTAWIQTYVVFIAKVSSGGSSINSLTYLLDNDEILMARSEATKAAIVLG